MRGGRFQSLPRRVAWGVAHFPTAVSSAKAVPRGFRPFGPLLRTLRVQALQGATFSEGGWGQVSLRPGSPALGHRVTGIALVRVVANFLVRWVGRGKGGGLVWTLGGPSAPEGRRS